MVDIRTGHSSPKTKQNPTNPKKPKSKQIYFFSKQVNKTMMHEQEKNFKNDLVFGALLGDRQCVDSELRPKPTYLYMNTLSYQHITIDCESFMCLARGSLIPCKHTDGPKARHDIVSTGKDQMAFMLNDKCIGDEFFFFLFFFCG